MNTPPSEFRFQPLLPCPLLSTPPYLGDCVHQALDQALDGGMIVVHTLDRLGRTVRDSLNLIHDLADRGVRVRNLADPVRVDSANPEDPISQLAVVMLALFAFKVP